MSGKKEDCLALQEKVDEGREGVCCFKLRVIESQSSLVPRLSQLRFGVGGEPGNEASLKVLQRKC